MFSISPRRSTIDIPLPTEEVEVTGFPPSNKTEKLKKAPMTFFKPRDRVKVLFPIEYKNRTGYVVEDEFVENTRGWLEVELDHILSDDSGYQTLTNPTVKRQRLMIKHPSKQLIPYKYMKCQQQHFVTDITAESLLRINHIITFILGTAILCLLFGIDRTKWNVDTLYYLYCLSQSICVGFGFYCILIISFIGLSIKRLSGYNNLVQLGAVHDDCTSYYWLKSTQFKPWWMCGRPVSAIEYTLKQTYKIMIIFIATFLCSILLSIADQVQWYLIIICIVMVIVPLLFAIDIIKNSIPDPTRYTQQQQQHATHTNTANHINVNVENDLNYNDNIGNQMDTTTKFRFNNDINPNSSISIISYSNNTAINHSPTNNNNTKKKGHNPFDD